MPVQVRQVSDLLSLLFFKKFIIMKILYYIIAVLLSVLVNCAELPVQLIQNNPYDPNNVLTYNLNRLGSFNTIKGAYGIYADNRSAYMAGGNEAIYLFRLADSPKPLIQFGIFQGTTISFHVDVTVSDSIAYVLTDSAFSLFSLRTSDYIYMLDVYQCIDYTNIFVHKKKAYLTKYDSLLTFDVSNPDTIQAIERYGPPLDPGNPCHVYVADNTVFLAAGINGLIILTQEPSLQEYSPLKTPGDAHSVVVIDKTAYVTLGDSGLVAVDVSDLNNPQIIGQCSTPHFINYLCSEDNVAYIFNHVAYILYRVSRDDIPGNQEPAGGGVYAVDISNPVNMRIISEYSGIENPYDIYAVGDRVFVTDRDKGLVVLKLELETQ